MTTFEDKIIAIIDQVSRLQLDSSLLFLNRLLAHSRGQAASEQQFQIFPHHVHAIVKLVLHHSSSLGIEMLTSCKYEDICYKLIALGDPLTEDPEWVEADPTGALQRMWNQQIPAQTTNHFQKIGIALSLFRNSVSNSPKLRGMIEEVLEMPVDKFIAMGIMASGATAKVYPGEAGFGIFSTCYLAEAYCQGFCFCVPEVWTPFLARTSCTPEEFRVLSQNPSLQVTNADSIKKSGVKVDATLYTPYEFNVLHIRPIIQSRPDSFVCVDPHILLERVTLGVFYDVFDVHGFKFTSALGDAFSDMIGRLLLSTLQCNAIWRDDPVRKIELEKTYKGKLGDWCVTCPSVNVLLECKSMRSSMNLKVYGTKVDVEEVYRRIAEALEQVSDQASEITANEHNCFGIPRRPCIGVIVTFGKVYAATSPFGKDQIIGKVRMKGKDPIPYVVLSAEEFDSVISLVEAGSEFGDIVSKMCETHDSFGPLQPLRQALEQSEGVSKMTRNVADHFLDHTVTSRFLIAPKI